MKKILPLILAIILVFSMASCAENKNENTQSTKEEEALGNNVFTSQTGSFEYQLNAEGKCEIVNYTPASVTLVDLELPTTLDNRDVVGIAPDAFKAENSIKSVKIPEGYTYVGNYAFYDCDSLETVTFAGSNVTEIGKGAFEGCSSLTSINLPSSVESIDNYAFKDCAVLTSIDVSGAKFIGEGAFFGCSALSSIVLCDELESISKTAFFRCDALAYTEENGALYLGSASNKYLALISVSDLNLEACTVNDATKVIAIRAFADCTLLESVTLGAAVTTVSASCFENSDALEFNENENGYYLGTKENPYMVLMALIIPSVEDFNLSTDTKIICDNAFENCVSLADIHFAGTTDEWNSIIKTETWNFGRSVRVMFADETEEPIIYQ